MDVKSLIPWGRNRNAPVPRYPDESSPLLALHREMNRLFDDFSRGFDLAGPFGWSGNWPSVEVSETDQVLKVTAELPGLEEKDVEVTLSDGMLTLKGEKKHERDGSLYSERWHGSFHRSIQLGPDVDPEKVTAAFKNGVLTKRLEALKFLVHLVADIHQPLHAADDEDRGGNDVHVEFIGRATNLHAVWDSGVLEAAGIRDERAYALDLDGLKLAASLLLAPCRRASIGSHLLLARRDVHGRGSDHRSFLAAQRGGTVPAAPLGSARA